MATVTDFEWFTFPDPDFDGFTGLFHTFRVDGRKAGVAVSVEDVTFSEMQNKAGYLRLLILELADMRAEFIEENA